MVRAASRPNRSLGDEIRLDYHARFFEQSGARSWAVSRPITKNHATWPVKSQLWSGIVENITTWSALQVPSLGISAETLWKLAQLQDFFVAASPPHRSRPRAADEPSMSSAE